MLGNKNDTIIMVIFYKNLHEYLISSISFDPYCLLSLVMLRKRVMANFLSDFIDFFLLSTLKHLYDVNSL